MASANWTVSPFYTQPATRINDSGANLTHYLAANDNYQVLKEIYENTDLKIKGNLRTKDFHGNSSLHYAASSSSHETASYIINAFQIDITDLINNQGITPAHIAAQRGDITMLEILNQKIPEVFDKASRRNWYPIHFASIYGQINVIKFLIKVNHAHLNDLTVGCDFLSPSESFKQYRYYSPLALACNEEVKALLIENGALPSLHAAALTNNLQGLSYHIFHGQTDINSFSEFRQWTPLQWAASKGNYAACNAILQNKGQPSIYSPGTLSPLELAIKCHSLESLQVIIPYSSKEDIQKATFTAASPENQSLFAALIRKYVRLSSKVDMPISTDSSNDSLLIRLLKLRAFSSSHVLIQSAPKILTNHKDSSGATAFHYAAAFDAELVKHLNPDSTMTDNAGRIPIMYSVLGQNGPGVEVLYETSSINQSDNSGLSPLSAALAFGIDTNDFLFNKFAQCGEGISFLTYDINLNILEENMKGNFICQKVKDSIASGRIKTFKRSMGPDGLLKGATVAHLAVMFLGPEDVNQFVSLLKNDPELIHKPTEKGWTPLFLAAALAQVEIINVLIRKGALTNVLDKSGSSIFHYIQNSDVFDKFSEVANLSSILSTPNDNNQLPLHFACKYGTDRLVKQMISIPGMLNCLISKDSKGKEPLEYALENDNYHQEVIEILNTHGVPNRLMAAIEKDDIKAVQVLIDSGYPVQSYDQSMRTPLHIAALTGNVKIADLLISHGASLNAVDATGQLPLHCAAAIGSYEMCIRLLGQGVDLSIFSPTDQPYLQANDQKLRDMLFHFWKRCYHIGSLMQLMKSHTAVLRAIDEAIAIVPEYLKDFRREVMKLDTDLVSVAEQVDSHFSDPDFPYNYSDSVHHLFSPLQIIDLSQYVTGLLKLTDVHKLNFPIHILTHGLSWVETIRSRLRLIQKHLLPGIDEIDSFEFILKKLDHQLANSTQIKQMFKINGIRATLVCSVRETQNTPIFIFNAQIFDYLQLHFGNDFVMPRSIPFSREDVVMTITERDLTLSSVKDQKSHVVIPLIFVLPKASHAADDFVLATPVGTLKISAVPLKNPKEAIHSKVLALLFRSELEELLLQIHGFDEGEGAKIIGSPMNRLFNCLISYQENGAKCTAFRFMCVRAGDSCECLDICYKHLIEVLSKPPVFTNVKTIEYMAIEDDAPLTLL